MSSISITETPNELTGNIDILDAEAILKLLSQTDSQIFNGYKAFPGLKDHEYINNYKRAHEILKRSILDAKQANESFKIVISGAGTSGRLAMLLASEFNDYYQDILGYPVFDFLIAGGNLALIKAQEGAEDDPIRGMQDLDDITKGCNRFLYIGITCGFSAHYISGQLYHTSVHRKQPAFLVGFNPLARARSILPENWDKGFSDVIHEIKAFPSMVFLDPIIGPEPITGSTRMKGGTATKIILESLFYQTLISLSRETDVPFDDFLGVGQTDNLEDQHRSITERFESAKDKIYDKISCITPMLNQAGDSLNQHGHIYYLGEGISGKMGIVDASECPPTYGADFYDVRGFIENGWASFCPRSQDFSYVENLFDIGFENFEQTVLPGLTARDTVIFTGSRAFYHKYAKLISECKTANVFKILIMPSARTCEDVFEDFNIVLDDARDYDATPILTSMSVKLIYNAITTAAHIFKGKIFKNKMIDLRISNNKLYHRCIHIIQELMGVSDSIAENSLLRSIYQTDLLTEEIKNAPISEHIKTAIQKEKIVPIALVLATGQHDFREAHSKVNEVHIVRNIIKELNQSPEEK